MFNPPAGLGASPVVVGHAVAALNGDLHLFKTLVELVLRQISDEMPDIRADVASQDTAALCASSHRLKGSLGAIAAMPSHQACSALNRLARIGAAGSYAMGLAHLEEELDRLRLFLLAWLAENEQEEQGHAKN